MRTYKQNDNFIVSGQVLHNDGSVNPSCRVVIYKLETEEEISKTTTNSLGNYRFIFPYGSLESGKYVVKFFGSGYSNKASKNLEAEKDWEYFEVAEENEPIVFLAEPVLTFIGESINDVDISANRDEYSVIKVMFENLLTKSGKLNKFYINYRESVAEGEEEKEWKKLGEFNYGQEFHFYPEDEENKVGEFEQGLFTIKSKLELYDKPISTYDFQIMFLNPEGTPAITELGETIYLTAEDVQFVGIIELTEYMGIPSDPEVVNVDGNELLSAFARVRWDNIKEMNRNELPITVYNGFDNSPSTLTYPIAQSIEKYVIFMYVRNSQENPAFQYPGTSAYWYYMGEYDNEDIQLRCPSNSWVGFWIGFRLKKKPTTQIEQKFLQY